MIQSLFPQGTTSSLGTFADISTAEKRHQQLSNVKFCMFEDMGGFQSNVRDYYKLVDNHRLSGRQLHNATGYTQQWHVRFMIASVLPLSIENSGDGWARRCIPLHLKRRDTTVVDPNLKEKLKIHGAEIIMWALNMEQSQRNNLIKTARFLPQMVEAQSEQSRNSSSVMQFIDACLEPSKNETDIIENAKLFDYYKAFCEAYGLKAFSMNAFLQHLKDNIFDHFVERKQLRMNGEKINISSHYKNIEVTKNVFNKANVSNTFECDKTYCKEGNLELFKDFFTQKDVPTEDDTLQRIKIEIGTIAEICINETTTEIIRVTQVTPWKFPTEIKGLNIQGQERHANVSDAVIFGEEEAIQRCLELNTTPEKIGFPEVGSWITRQNDAGGWFKDFFYVVEIQKGAYLSKAKGQSHVLPSTKQWIAVDKKRYAEKGLVSGMHQ